MGVGALLLTTNDLSLLCVCVIEYAVQALGNDHTRVHMYACAHTYIHMNTYIIYSIT